MSFRTTGVLLVILIALGAFVYFYDMRTPKAAEDPKEKALEILDYSGLDTEINRLEVTQGDKVTRLVSKEGEGWLMEAPEQAPADMTRVTTAVGALSMLKATALISENAEDAAKYGLDKPQLTVSVGARDKETRELLAGMLAPTRTGYYVKLAEDNRIFLVSSYIIEDLQKLVTEPPKATPTPTPLPTLVPTVEPSATPTP